MKGLFDPQRGSEPLVEKLWAKSDGGILDPKGSDISCLSSL